MDKLTKQIYKLLQDSNPTVVHGKSFMAKAIVNYFKPKLLEREKLLLDCQYHMIKKNVLDIHSTLWNRIESCLDNQLKEN